MDASEHCCIKIRNGSTCIKKTCSGLFSYQNTQNTNASVPEPWNNDFGGPNMVTPNAERILGRPTLHLYITYTNMRSIRWRQRQTLAFPLTQWYSLNSFLESCTVAFLAAARSVLLSVFLLIIISDHNVLKAFFFFEYLTWLFYEFQVTS